MALCRVERTMRCSLLAGFCLLFLSPAGSPFPISAPPKKASSIYSILQDGLISASTTDSFNSEQLCGTWLDAKLSLRHPDCCVVSVSNLTSHLQTMQNELCGEEGPDDLDLRIRVRCDSYEAAYEDCDMIRRAVMSPLAVGGVDDVRQEYQQTDVETESNDVTTQALVELCRGIASLADGPLANTVQDVHLRIVCASSYRARDPMFHTDKCPLRGYVTLTGPGTEYMSRICTPVEYGLLRTFGGEALENGNGNNNALRDDLESARELDFIVMKGDCYDAPLPLEVDLTVADQLLSKVWKRVSACVHRSPPVGGGDNGRRRVIVSLDLADGDDDQEWFVSGQRRGWRSGMTQRKSRLVA